MIIWNRGCTLQVYHICPDLHIIKNLLKLYPGLFTRLIFTVTKYQTGLRQ